MKTETNQVSTATHLRAIREHVYGANGLPLFNAGTCEMAETVVKAVNSHAELLEALRWSEAMLANLEGYVRSEAQASYLIGMANIRAAIAKAESA